MDATPHDITTDGLKTMDPRDRDLLLSVDPSEQLGLIIKFNQDPRYHNSLDAIALMANLREVSLSSGRAMRAQA